MVFLHGLYIHLLYARIGSSDNQLKYTVIRDNNNKKKNKNNNNNNNNDDNSNNKKKKNLFSSRDSRKTSSGSLTKSDTNPLSNTNQEF